MKSVKLILLFIVLFAVHLSAQTPGYLGKKVFVEFSPEFSILTTQYAPLKNITYNFNLDYVIARRMQLGVDYGVFAPHLAKSPDSRLGTNVSLKGKMIGAHYIFYIKNSLAPVGTYLGLQYRRLSGKYTDLSEGEINLKENTYGFIWGERRIFFDRMVFHVSGGMNLSPGQEDDLGFSFEDQRGKEKLAKIYYFNLGFGIGVLLF